MIYNLHTYCFKIVSAWSNHLVTLESWIDHNKPDVYCFSELPNAEFDTNHFFQRKITTKIGLSVAFHNQILMFLRL